MDDIAKELGISKRTIYQHFADKEAILRLVIEEELNSQQCEIEKLDEDSNNPIGQMIEVSRQIRICMMNMNPTLFYDLKKYYPEAWNLFLKFRNEYILPGIRENMTEGIQLGLYRSDIDVDILSQLRIGQIELAFDPTAYPPSKYNIEDIQVQFIHHFLRGILTKKGFELYNTIKNKTAIEFNTHEK